MWSRDGRQLFYLGPDQRIAVVTYRAEGGSFIVEKPIPWSMVQIWNEQDLAPSGNRFVIEGQPRGDLADNGKSPLHVTFLLNFFDEVRRRLSRADKQ